MILDVVLILASRDCDFVVPFSMYTYIVKINIENISIYYFITEVIQQQSVCSCLSEAAFTNNSYQGSPGKLWNFVGDR